MVPLREEVFYRTGTFVRKGDEFYQIVLEHCPDVQELAFRIQIFHGAAGSPPEKPVSDECFQTQNAAEEKFSWTVAQIEGNGFSPHSWAVHGDGQF